MRKKTNQEIRQEKPIDNSLCRAEFLAKTYGSSAGRTVLDHCQIVGEVAKEIIARMPAWLREKLFPDGAELIAAIHDIGKISPYFQEKIYRNVDGYQRNTYLVFGLDPETEKNWGGHPGVSLAATDKQGANLGKFIPEIVGRHHGYFPQISCRTATSECFGGQEWQDKREECIDELKKIFHCSGFPKVTDQCQSMVFSGLTTTADWIGSGSCFDDPSVKWQLSGVKKALDDAGFIKPQVIKNLSFFEVFGFSPHDVQMKLIDAVTSSGSGAYLMEAPMGIGKTEAALYAAYLALSNDQATGIYFALPTQLTSDKIHDRVNAFLQKILAPECQHRRALLLHGNAWLKETEIGEEGHPGRSWFNASKRGILAPFAVGTIDQALMAVMNVKHGFVRTFGLVGKVVILDEVHSYDSYTGTILDELIKVLRKLHCTVIILSATLTKDRRKSFFAGLNPSKCDYPLITSLHGAAHADSAILKEVSAKILIDAEVRINLTQSDDAAIEEVLLRAQEGQQILWIENTVNAAQDKYKLLAARCFDNNIACGLLHSRFLQTDRRKNEKYWVALYGKGNNEQRKRQGRILVGTQVLEQSLDIDADFLVTRIAPTDMVLQRVGRLWRHEAVVRPKTARREAWILAPSLSAVVGRGKKLEQIFGDSAKIYAAYILFRSLEVWEKHKAIILPRDIRQLIEETYVERDELDFMLNDAKYELKNKCENMRRAALTSVSRDLQTLPENKAATRYGEQDLVEVLLIREYRVKEKCVKLLGGEEVCLVQSKGKIAQDLKKGRRLVAAKLMGNIVKVADYLAPKKVAMKELDKFKGYLYVGDKHHDEAILRVAVVQKGGELLALGGGGASDEYDLRYYDKLGYQAKKIGKNKR